MEQEIIHDNFNLLEMRLAVPTRGNCVDDHFGHCEAYTVFTVDSNNKIEKIEMLPSPQGCGCKSNIAAILKEKGVSVILAGNMGEGALNVLRSYEIDVYRGCVGNVHKIVEDYLQGKIDDSGASCNHHSENGEGHVCNH